MARAPKRQPRRREARLSFDALSIEGALIQTEVVGRIAATPATPAMALEYGLDDKENLRTVVQAKYAEAQAKYARFLASDRTAKPLERFATELFKGVFDFADLEKLGTVVVDERPFPIGHQALSGRVPIVFAPFEQIDAADKAFGDGGRRRAPAQLLQEYLNAQDAALWGLACDGRTIRLYRDNAALTRPAYIEADLAMMLDQQNPRLSDFSALWLLIHATRFGRPATPPTDCPLERWREEGRESGSRAREELRGGVERALKDLGIGFLAHPDNAALRTDLQTGKLTTRQYLDGLLRLIYRLIFVFAAEDRDVLHVPQPTEAQAFEAWRASRDLYRRGYGLSRLRELTAKRRSHDTNTDGWEGAKILFRELHKGQAALALPALGGLFGASNNARDFADCTIANRHFYSAIFGLSWINDDSVLQRVNWRNMETEELGSVYESLLELEPSLSGPDGFEFITVAGHKRKETASYYTPDSLVQALLDETLDPLVAERTKGKDGQHAIDALLDLKIIDPACGSGHFLLAAARRLAVQCAQFDKPGAAPSPSDYRHWLREVARRSLYGVDKNPMAIELAKVALWIETVEPGKPLSFLDAHLRCGDALLGVYDLEVLKQGIPDDAYKALTGDNKAAASAWRKINKTERERDAGTLEMAYADLPDVVAKGARQVEAAPEDDLAQVEAKAEAFGKLVEGQTWHRLHTACHLYVAAFLMPKLTEPRVTDGAAGITVPTTAAVRETLAGRTSVSNLEAKALHAAAMARAFHWPLEFPQVFFPGEGKAVGFDLALGNPPWERIKLQEQEFFSSRDVRIAKAGNKAERQKLIDALATADATTPERMLFDEFITAKRVAEASSVFARTDAKEGGRFPLTGTGDVNTYALFSELFGITAKRAGIIVPTELATSDTTKAFFGHIVDTGRLRSMYDFQTGMGFFDRIGHARFKFALFVIEPPRKAANPDFKVAFFLRTQADMADKSRYLTMTNADIAAINPNTRTAPIFRSKADAELTKQIYARVPVLIDDSKRAAGNPWGITFNAMFHMSGDSGSFRTAKQLTADRFQRDGRDWVSADGKARSVPLYEAKMVHHYDHRWATYEEAAGDDDSRHADTLEKQDADFEVAPRYWVTEADVKARLAAKGWNRGWLMGWRDICRATDERTTITGAIPLSAVGDKFLLMLPAMSPQQSAALISILSSLAFDYVARQKLGGTSFKYYTMKQIALPPPNSIGAAEVAFVTPRVLELTYTSHSMKPFADDLGYTGNGPFAWDEDRRALLRAELDATIAKLYGLTRDQLRYILDPADVYGPDYPSETFRVLQKNETAKFGEYRTRRLVLDAWDRLERGEMSDTWTPPVHVTTKPKPVVLVDLGDGALLRPQTDQRLEIQVLLVGLLRQMDNALPMREVRQAALWAIEPHLLVPYLKKPEAAQWQRVIGDEAKIKSGTSAFVPRANAAWGGAVTLLRGNACLIEDLEAGTWAPGTGLNHPDLPMVGWAEGRAGFVLDILRRVGIEKAKAALSEDRQEWVDGKAA
jgi:hypothetical protein